MTIGIIAYTIKLTNSDGPGPPGPRTYLSLFPWNAAGFSVLYVACPQRSHIFPTGRFIPRTYLRLLFLAYF